MVSIKMQTMRTGISTTTGTQDFTISGFGTPKAVLFIFPTAPTDATANNNAIFGFGAADGTRQWSISTSSRNSSANTVDWKRGMTDKCIHLITVTGGVVGEAHFDSWITDGVRINWTTAFSIAALVTVVLIGGSDLTARVDTINLGTSTSAQTYNSLSNTANVLLTATTNSAFNDVSVQVDNLVLGIATNHPSNGISQQSMSITEAYNVTQGAPFAQVMNDRFAFYMTPATGAIDYEVTLSNFTSTGFDFTCSSSGNSHDIGIIALNLGGGDFKSGQISSPTSTGSFEINTTFTPHFCLLGLTGCTANDTLEGDGDAGVLGVSAIDSTSQFSNSLAIEYNSPTTDTQTYSDNVAVALPAHDGASQLYTASLTSFAPTTGVTLNFSAANATARQWIYLILSTDSIPTGGSSVVSTTFGIFDSFLKPRSFIKGMKCQNI